MLNVIALLVATVVTPVYTNTYTEGGVTYSQLGGIKSSNYVATAVSLDPMIMKLGTNGFETIGGDYLSVSDIGAVPIWGGFIGDTTLRGAFEFGPSAYMHIQREPLDDEHDETYFYVDHFVRKYRPQGERSAPIQTLIINLPVKSGTLAVESDIPTTLSSLTGDSTHRLVTDADKTTWNGKQNAISDLAEIRAGATAGSTAVQRGGDTMTGKLTVSTGNDTTTGFRARMNDNNWIEYKSGNIHVRSGTISGTRIFTFPETGGILSTREEPHLAVINGELHIITEHDTEAIYE